MRIAYLSGAYIPSRGANSMHVMCMCEAMGLLGHEVTLFSRPGDIDVGNDFEFYDVKPVFTVSKQHRPQVRAWGAIVNAFQTRKALVADQKPDLIYAREVWALSLTADLGIPFIFESHWLPRNAIQKAAEVRLLRHPQLRKVVFISEALRQYYIDLFPWLDRQLTLVAHDAANVVAPDVEFSPSSLGRRGGLQVGYVGSFHVGCGMDIIAKTAALLPEEDFHIFGGSSKEVSAWAERTSKISNLTFHGFVSPSTLPSIYEALDVVLSPYQSDTPHIGWISPMKLFEYMAQRKPIVSSDFPVLREIVEHKVNGILVKSDSAQEWAQAIRELRDDIEYRSKIGDAGYNFLVREHTWHTRAEKILAV